MEWRGDSQVVLTRVSSWTRTPHRLQSATDKFTMNYGIDSITSSDNCGDGDEKTDDDDTDQRYH